MGVNWESGHGEVTRVKVAPLPRFCSGFCLLGYAHVTKARDARLTSHLGFPISYNLIDYKKLQRSL